MVIVRLAGGLGNQLFQYAVGRVLSWKNAVPLKLDASLFKTYKLHFYSLSPYRTIQDIASSNEVYEAKLTTFSTYRARLKKISEILIPYYKRSYVKERSFCFDPNILLAGEDVYLDGYWQSEKYFTSYKEKIRDEFTVISKQIGIDKKIAQQIAKTNSVSLHIRRADYVSNPVTHAFHGICSLEYYSNAIKYIEKQVKNPHFYIFSDDKKWSSRNIRISHPTIYIDHNGPEKNYEDLRLMSSCQHQIIANSTFSWWGAWLNKNPRKLVIAPKQWFSNSQIDTKDLYLSDWKRL